MAFQADVVYRYDGSFDGFLSCVFESFLRKEIPFAIYPDRAAWPTLFPIRRVPTDPARAARVFDSFEKKLGTRTRDLVTRAFLNDSPDKELTLLRFLHFAYGQGPRAPWMQGHERVAPVLALEKAVNGEAHLLTGFVRFEQRGGALGAVIQPRHFVLPLLRQHFCNRYPGEDFVIWDKTHRAVLAVQAGRAEYLELATDPDLPPPDEEEARFQAMWRAFYDALAIPARYNPNLRRSHCPKRYWACMTELRDQL